MRWKYQPLVEITINQGRLIHNLEVHQKASGLPVAPVLKSNAYGHGLLEVAKILANEKVPFLVVDSYHEALILRNKGIRTPILIIGFSAFENIYHNQIGRRLKDVAFTFSSLEQIKEISKNLQKPTAFHLKIDTGMHRQGVLSVELSEALELIHRNPHIRLEGVCSHLADGENEFTSTTDEQIRVWHEALTLCEKACTGHNHKNGTDPVSPIKWQHLSASSGIFHSQKIRANVMRLGLGLYGISSNPKRDENNGQVLDLLPVLEMHSIISGTKKIRAGAEIGYNGTFTAPTSMTIAPIPAGYFEGSDRRWSTKGFVKIVSKATTSEPKHSHFCPIVGLISMNITTIDISALPEFETKIGTAVTLISSDPKDKNSVAEIARLDQTIPYEILIHIPQQLRRKII